MKTIKRFKEILCRDQNGEIKLSKKPDPHYEVTISQILESSCNFDTGIVKIANFKEQYIVTYWSEVDYNY